MGGRREKRMAGIPGGCRTPISSPAPLCEGGRWGRRGGGHLRGGTQKDGLGREGGANEGAWFQRKGRALEGEGPL